LFVDDPMCENSHIGVVERCDRLPALHAAGEHREDLSRELLDFGIGWPRSNVHPGTIAIAAFARESRRIWYQMTSANITESKAGPSRSLP
jgi:hypothetical protein